MRGRRPKTPQYSGVFLQRLCVWFVTQIVLVQPCSPFEHLNSSWYTVQMPPSTSERAGDSETEWEGEGERAMIEKGVRERVELTRRREGEQKRRSEGEQKNS